MGLYDKVKVLSGSKNNEDIKLAQELCGNPENKLILDREISTNLDDSDKTKFEYYLRKYPGDKIFKYWPNFYLHYVSRTRN